MAEGGLRYGSLLNLSQHIWLQQLKQFAKKENTLEHMWNWTEYRDSTHKPEVFWEN